MFIWYEELMHDQTETLKRLANFVLGHSLEGDDKIGQLRERIKIENMRKNAMEKSANEKLKKKNERFYRKGEVGDWKNHFEDGRAKVWDEWIEDNLKGTDIKEDFEDKTGMPFY